MASKPTPRSYKQGWENQHTSFVSIATESKLTIVLIGDSIINRLCRYRRVWSELSEPVNALNFGIRGDRTQHVLWRIQNGEIPVNVESVVIHCGTNNLDKDSPAEIKKGITSMAYAILKRKPCINIIVTGLLPRDSKGSPRRQQISWINERLEHWCNNLAKKNMLFLKPDTDWTKLNGQLYFQDLLHLSEKGNYKFSCAIINILTQKSPIFTAITTNRPPSTPIQTHTTFATTTHINTSDITTEITPTDITSVNTLTTGTLAIDTTNRDITTTETSTTHTNTSDIVTTEITSTDITTVNTLTMGTTTIDTTTADITTTDTSNRGTSTIDTATAHINT